MEIMERMPVGFDNWKTDNMLKDDDRKCEMCGRMREDCFCPEDLACDICELYVVKDKEVLREKCACGLAWQQIKHLAGRK